LKRLESSVNSFRLTLTRIQAYIKETIQTIDAYEQSHGSSTLMAAEAMMPYGAEDFEDGEDLTFATKKSKISLADMDYVSWRRDLAADLERFDLLLLMLKDITPSTTASYRCSLRT
jgi:phosphoribosyl 1,2-cyclic phosphodiesterase